MSHRVVVRCGVCRCYIDQEDLFCSNCGTEAPHRAASNQRLPSEMATHSFQCQGCGASMSYDASAQALRCPFCGGQEMKPNRHARVTKPRWVIPRQIEQPEAETILRKWLGQGFWRPVDAARAARIGKITAVYVPYWVFSANTDTRWTADASPAPPGSRGDWYPLSGHLSSSYEDILIGGSGVLTRQETSSIMPFDLSRGCRPEKIDLRNCISEEFQVPRRHARPQAKREIETREAAAAHQQIAGRPRNLRVNVLLSALAGHPVLLPVWILAYRYKQHVHRVLINGQTGKIAGSAPFSYGKLALIVAITIAIVGLIAGLIWLVNL